MVKKPFAAAVKLKCGTSGCQQKYLEPTMLAYHRESVHHSQKSSIYTNTFKFHYCDSCEKSFSSKILLNRHIVGTHGKVKGRYKKESACDGCGDEKLSANSLGSHVCANTSHYSCTNCDFVTTEFKMLKQHLPQHIQAVSPLAPSARLSRLTCHNCGYVASKHDHFKRHLPKCAAKMSKKADPTFLRCPLCPGVYAQAVALRAHLNTACVSLSYYRSQPSLQHSFKKCISKQVSAAQIDQRLRLDGQPGLPAAFPPSYQQQLLDFAADVGTPFAGN